MIEHGMPIQLVVPAAFVFGVGLLAFARGLSAYRQGARIGAIATSRAASLAGGEVRLTGVVEPLVQTLVSPLQSEPCIWYRANVRETGENGRSVLDEERAVEFGLRDATGMVRIIPRDAHWNVRPAYDESTGFLGDEPMGLNRRSGAASTVPASTSREAAIASLLTIRPPAPALEHDAAGALLSLGGLGGPGGPMERRKHYQEWRIVPGETITVVGQARPFGDVFGSGTADAAIDADLDEARRAGSLAPNAAEAWGNAAIPGFGIGRPTRTPELDAGADTLPTAGIADAERAERLFEVADHELVIAGGSGAALSIHAGTPGAAAAIHERGLVVGLGGAALATASALVMAFLVTGRL